MEDSIFFTVIILNVINFLAYGLDKFKAKFDFYRISEKTLLTFSLIAGFGGFAGMQIFRHKTRKSIFYLANFIGMAVSIYLMTKI
ncbi:DUF1294 domain-containing protein [Peptoniphilus sp. MSJ-1]|uniref:DUF1294 domain-containing protein n=1 Tax=Peptoniphilus ovalis TaxID=2841503 RepID=A0ABS6FJ29_9FIRM|nr:DUF1294 domain-containing protein [Peptoniphilus ovalis]MBU5670068.1 DUF1294 domain-containing protein [Peptoniphilus ovalis]